MSLGKKVSFSASNVFNDTLIEGYAIKQEGESNITAVRRSLSRRTGRCVSGCDKVGPATWRIRLSSTSVFEAAHYVTEIWEGA